MSTKKAKSKPGRKKLTLNKETLKDLTSRGAGAVRGGAAKAKCSEGWYQNVASCI